MSPARLCRFLVHPKTELNSWNLGRYKIQYVLSQVGRPKLYFLAEGTEERDFVVATNHGMTRLPGVAAVAISNDHFGSPLPK